MAIEDKEVWTQMVGANIIFNNNLSFVSENDEHSGRIVMVMIKEAVLEKL